MWASRSPEGEHEQALRRQQKEGRFERSVAQGIKEERFDRSGIAIRGYSTTSEGVQAANPRHITEIKDAQSLDKQIPSITS